MPVTIPSGVLQRSAQDLIKSALRLVGSLRSGQNLSGDELSDCLLVLNDMMDAYSAERMVIPAVFPLKLDQNQNPFTLVGSKASYKLGNVNQNEDFLTPRPSRIERISILYNASQSTPVELPLLMHDDVTWQGVPNKSVTSILPQECFVDESLDVFPDMVIYFYPIPTQANQVIFYVWDVLTLFPDPVSKFFFPPAYSEFLRYNLAVRLAAEFPCDLQKFQIVQKLATESKSRVAGINVRARVATSDEALVGSYSKMGNIFSGSANRSTRQ